MVKAITTILVFMDLEFMDNGHISESLSIILEINTILFIFLLVIIQTLHNLTYIRF